MNFLTPDSDEFEGTVECRTITLPPSLWPLIGGALERLTAVYNWDEQGDATPEECAQFFMGVIDQFVDSRCGMKFVQQPTYNLINNETYTQDGRSFAINHGMLPSEAQGTSGIYVRLNINHSTANQIVQASDKAGNGLVYALGTTASITHRTNMIIPMNEDGADIKSLSANGTSVVLGVFLVGWF